jgi:hypothetical protein
MIGMHRQSGQALAGNAHLAQSIGDILSTPLGSRVMRRDYGSMLIDLIDQPINPATRQLVFAATAVAIARWEPRLKLKAISISPGTANGELTINLSGERTDLPRANDHVRLSIPIRRGGATTVAALN